MTEEQKEILKEWFVNVLTLEESIKLYGDLRSEMDKLYVKQNEKILEVKSEI